MHAALVGRDGEFGKLTAALDRAVAGTGGVVLVTGPAGIGKTRLCDEVHALAREWGISAAWTVCWESGSALTLAPWVDLLGQLGRSVEASSGSDDPVLARTIRFDRVLSELRDLAGGEPRLLVLDDLQWAEPSSLELLARAVGALRGLPMLVVTTARTTLAGGFGLGLLDELARHCELLALRPLGDDAIAAVAAGVASDELDVALQQEVVTRAAGNPLFARELAALYASPDSTSRAAWLASATHGVPHALRSLLLRPLDDLGHGARAAIAAVAVAGDQARLDVLSPVLAELDRSEVLRSLAEATREGVIVSVGADEYRLHHPLLRAAIVEQLDPVERASLHQRVGDALEGRAAHDPAAAVALADHLLRGAAIAPRRRVVQYALRAATISTDNAGYEQAAQLLGRALALIEDDASAGDRGEVLLALGAARWAAGDAGRGRRALLDAAHAAVDEGRPELLARAALALGGSGGFEVRLFDSEQIHLLEDARHALGSAGDPVLRSWVSARLSVALSLTATEADRAGLAEHAVALARESGDAAALAHALAAWCDVRAGPDHVGERVAAATEILELAAQVRDPAVELLGRRLRVVARLEAGDMGGANADIEAFARVAGPLADPRFGWVTALWQAMRALYDGRADDFLEWNARVGVLGEQAASGGADVLAIGQRWMGLVALGRVDEANELWAAHRPEEHFGQLGPMMIGSTALAAAVAGDLDRAASLLDRFDLDELPKDSEWLSSLSQLADAAALTDDRRLAGPLYEALTPYAGLWVIDGIGSVIRGPVQRWIDELGAPHIAVGTSNRFALRDDVWAIAFDGDEVHVRDSKGIRDLARLLAHPGREIAALELIADGTATVLQHDTGETLDETARAAYRARVEQLRHELDAADGAGDPARSQRLHEELDSITGELRRSAGLGGRTRRQGSSVQHARTAVTGRIREAIKRIDAAHPRLGEHLRASIRTGAECAYDPPEPVDWRL